MAMLNGKSPSIIHVLKDLDIIPARINLAKLESKLVGDFDAPFRLKDRLEAIRQKLRCHRHRHSAHLGLNYSQCLSCCLACADPHTVLIFCAGGHG